MPRLLVVFVLACAGLARAGGDLAAAYATGRIDLEVTLDPARGDVSGRVVARVEVERAESSLLLLLAPNAFAVRPAAADVAFHRLYPEAFDAGWMRVLAARTRVCVAGVCGADLAVTLPAAQTASLELALPAPASPGATVVVELTFQAHLPARTGLLGCLGGACTAAVAGLLPVPAAPTAAGWSEAAPAPLPLAGSLTLAGGEDGLLGGQRFRGRVELAGELVTEVVLVAAPRLHERRQGTLGWVASSPPPPPVPAAPLPYSAEDIGAEALVAAARATALLGELGAPAGPLVLARAPLRADLAVPSPGLVLVSDWLFGLFPAARFRKFHERELLAAVAAAALWPRLGRRDAEAAGVFVADLDLARRRLRRETARDILRPVAFVPAVDELLYSPEVAFAGAYFGDVGGAATPGAEDPRRGPGRASGRLLYEKLRDRLTPEELHGLFLRVVAGEPLVAAAEALRPGLGAWLERWDGPYPVVDYAVGGVASVDAAGGLRRHTAIILRRVPPGQTPLAEAVTIRLRDSAGHSHDLVWDGEGERGEVAVVCAAAAISSVEVDPRHRLVETSLASGAAAEDPRLDDRVPARWKVVYQGLGALLSVMDLDFGLLGDFSLRRVHDTRNELRLLVSSTSEAPFGASVGYLRHFGPLVTPARRASALAVTLGAVRLAAYAGSGEGYRASLTASLLHETRQTWFEPRRGTSFALRARGSLVTLDGEDAVRPSLVLLADAARIATPADRHTLVAAVDAAVAVGDVGRSQLVSAGGVEELRGYPAAALRGRARVVGHLEWRGLLAGGIDWNLGHLITLRRVGAAAFVDAGAVSDCDALRFGPSGLYAAAGVGLRLFYDDLGVQPGMLALDLAAPLVFRRRGCDGVASSPGDGPPFMLYLTFLPPF